MFLTGRSFSSLEAPGYFLKCQVPFIHSFKMNTAQVCTRQNAGRVLWLGGVTQVTGHHKGDQARPGGSHIEHRALPAERRGVEEEVL